VSYLRVSTREQARRGGREEGFSIPAQRAANKRKAMSIGAIVTRPKDEPLIDWQEAVHPLLLLAHRKAGKTVVPLDLTLDRDRRLLIISGPNAGGKSVCLKTVGLLQYMLQCGIPIPLNERSRTGIFERIFIDRRMCSHDRLF